MTCDHTTHQPITPLDPYHAALWAAEEAIAAAWGAPDPIQRREHLSDAARWIAAASAANDQEGHADAGT